MSELQQKLQADILKRLKGRKNPHLTRRDFDKAETTIKKRFQCEKADIEKAVETLLREQYVSRTGRGTYKLETKGVDHLVNLESALSGPPPEINEEMLHYQKAFVLMQLFGAKDGSQSRTRSDLYQKLESKEVAKQALLFARLSSDPLVNPDRPTIDWVVRQLVQSKDIDEPNKNRFRLTDRGKESLMATDQHPSLDFRIKGKQLNALREAIREVIAVAHPKPEQRDEQTGIPSVAIPVVQPSLTAEAVLAVFGELRSERFARNGIVPVYELRRLLIARYGAETGSHAFLDPLLKKLRREKQLRLIAIGNLNDATPDQLNDSVPGENETFFYLEAAHEYAPVR